MRIIKESLHSIRNILEGATGSVLATELLKQIENLLSGNCRPSDIMKSDVINMKLEEAKTLYQGEWIAFRTSEEGDNPEGDVVLHNKDRRAFDKELLQRGLTDIYITFAGPPVPEGYAVIF